MKQPIRRGSPYLIPAIFLLLIGAIATLTLRQAGAGQAPDIPDFEGEPFEITINGLELPRQTLAAAGGVSKAGMTSAQMLDICGVSAVQGARA
jgi:hypothetical protein